MGLVSFLNENGFARKDVSPILESQLTESDTFGRNHVARRTLNGGRGPCANKKRADSISVPECQNCDGGQLLFS